ncbi:putative ribonuclease H-like domain-containing protein [Tanacetum coccineum]
MPHPCPKRNVVPKAILMRSGLVSLTTVRPVNTSQPRTTMNSARPITNVFNKAYSTIRRPINKNTTFKNSNFNQRVNIVKDKNVNAARPKAVVNAARPKAVLNAVKGNQVNAVKASTCWVWKPKTKVLDHDPRNMSYLTDFEEIDGGYVAFGGNPKGGKITGRGTIKTGNLDFENVYFVRELKFNLFSVSQMCDKKNSVLFNDTECIVLSPNFKLTDESHVLLKVPRKNNMYSVDLKNIVPKGGLTCLFAKATSDESKLWHRRLGHINFKTMNKLVKGNLVRGLPSKLFENNQTCVACQKGKQHRASCKSKTVSSISQPLHMLHMDLFGPTFVKSLMKKMYCLVVTDDYSRFSWVFFLATKDETSSILKSFITRVENLLDKRAKVIRCDNGTEFKNKEMNQFCKRKGGYYDLEGDVTYLESLLSDDTTHKLYPEVFFDHEPQQLRNEPENEPLITFSPKSDPLHHEFTGELITIPPRIVREHEDYINRMSLLCVIESDFNSEEDIIDNLLNDDPISEYERLTFNIEPDVPVINNVDELNKDECFDPGGVEINVEVDNSFTFVSWIFIPYLTYPEVSPLLSSTKNEDTIFDPGIST